MILALALAAATWTWNGPSADGRTITLDLVRAEVVIEPVVGPSRIAIEAAESAASIEIVERDRAVLIGDRYPERRAIASLAECLPPVDPRGDYWTYRSGSSCACTSRPASRFGCGSCKGIFFCRPRPAASMQRRPMDMW